MLPFCSASHTLSSVPLSGPRSSEGHDSTFYPLAESLWSASPLLLPLLPGIEATLSPCCCPIPGDLAFKIPIFYSLAIFKAKSISSYGLFTRSSAIFCLHPFSLILSTSSVFLSGFFSAAADPIARLFMAKETQQDGRLRKRPFSNRGKNWGLKNIGRGHLPLRGVRGRVDREGRPQGAAWGDARTEGAGTDRVSGAGRALQNPKTGERTRPPGAERARLRGANPLREGGLYMRRGRQR